MANTHEPRDEHGPSKKEDDISDLPKFVHEWEQNNAPSSPEGVQEFFGRSPEELDTELNLLIQEGHAKILANIQEEKAIARAKTTLKPPESTPPTPPTGKNVPLGNVQLGVEELPER